jgi:hypothetical protein
MTSNIPIRSFTCHRVLRALCTALLMILPATLCTSAIAFSQPPNRIGGACS